MSATAVRMPISREVAEAAADWLLRLHADEVSDTDRAAWTAWRAASAEHEQAWRRLDEMSLRLKALPSTMAMAALDRPQVPSRRRVLGQLVALLTLGTTGYAVHQRVPAWTADHRTALGERRHLPLPDGSSLQLNTATAVDLAFDDQLRRVSLIEGEVLVQTHVDPQTPSRPFVVDTAQGRIVALGTRFTVRQDDGDTTLVSVHEHAVEVQVAGRAPSRIGAGQTLRFSRASVESPTSVDPNAEAWTRGLLYADRMSLAELTAELSRYTPGILRCDAAVAAVQVSGAFPLDAPDDALALLERTLPVRIERRFGYWRRLVARS